MAKDLNFGKRRHLKCLSKTPAGRGLSSGFTLIELVVVIVILGVLAAAAAPRLIQTDSQDRATAEQLRSTLRHAQRIAVTRNRDVCVTVAAKSASFRIASVSGTGVACGVLPLEPLGNSGDVLDMSIPAASALRFTATGNFRFTPSGSLANNGGTVLTVARTLSVMRGAVLFASLSVQPDNGFVLASNF